MRDSYMQERRLSAFSIDLECGISLELRDLCGIDVAPSKRVEALTDKLLSLTLDAGVSATFFVVGKIASKFPNLIRRIAAAGHEVGLHSHEHHLLNKLTPRSAWEDTLTAKRTVEDITGLKVRGYRAPAFSLTRDVAWFFEILADLDFEYDSSVMPATRGKRSWRDFPKMISEVTLPDGRSIVEFPATVLPLAGTSFPCCGGGYLRHYPYWFTRWAVECVARDRPVNVYIHPYDLDTEAYPDIWQRSIKALPLKRRIAIGLRAMNKPRVLPRLTKLFQLYPFSSCFNVISSAQQNGLVKSYPIVNFL
jgi:polysaccharide deacetylase family protein (PEP-CTERM system associated)